MGRALNFKCLSTVTARHGFENIFRCTNLFQFIYNLTNLAPTIFKYTSCFISIALYFKHTLKRFLSFVRLRHTRGFSDFCFGTMVTN